MKLLRLLQIDFSNTSKRSGSRDHWVRVGMAIHSVLPNDMGLHLWSSWSSEDPDYAEEWENGNPCKDVFYSFKSKSSGIGLGTLIWLADREDPERRRFTETVKRLLKKQNHASYKKQDYPYQSLRI